ncbi:helix-turn-helix domain-containing protein [Peiella sedimenti]|uniref:helix-turn-helix domain-containing protein n=1 Tax=Peiella sedimenti TaxID=3061083 RepID=UPI003CC71683
MFWERDEREPFIHFYPALIAYLGYEPWSEPNSLGERLRLERRRRGVRIDQAARLVGVDEGTWRRWERGEWRVARGSVPDLSAFLRCRIATAYPSAIRSLARR